MKNTALVQYFVNSWNELRKVTWPTKQQSVRLAIIVLVTVFATSMLLALFDFLFSRGYQFLLTISQGSAI